MAKTKPEGKARPKAKPKAKTTPKPKKSNSEIESHPLGTPNGVAFLLHGGVMRKRDEIVAEIKRIAEKLGRAPSKAELCKSGRIIWHQVYKHLSRDEGLSSTEGS